MGRWSRKAIWTGGVSLAALGMMGVMGATFAHPAATTGTSSTGPDHTITVLGVAGQSVGSSTGTMNANVNLRAQSSSAKKALSQIQSEESGVAKAVEAVGVSSGNITVNNQSINVNGGPPRKPIPLKSMPLKKGQGIQYNANENVQISMKSDQETAVLAAIVKSLSSSNNSFNVYVNAIREPASAGPADAATIGQAMDVAKAEATAVAKKMGVTLGAVQSVKQVHYQGPYVKPNMNMVELQVVYQVQ